MDAEAVSVIRREALDLDSRDPAIRRSALATIAQAVHELYLSDPEAEDFCAKITHENGRLIDRYADA